MLTMKGDMGGAATVAGLMYAVAKNKLNVHVIGVIPATDNRPGKNAYVPSDIIRMYNGLNVEILNTDAEGRLILADALSYAAQYNPDMVCDIATLTGSAASTAGKHASIIVGNVGDEIMNTLKKSGKETFERLIELPLWEEYAESLKSEIADLKNLGKEAGAITAAKFLERFTDYPWFHIDIAGTFFFESKEKYRGIGGSGVGVRLIYDFLKKHYYKK